jgi:hypothetical protein
MASLVPQGREERLVHRDHKARGVRQAHQALTEPPDSLVQLDPEDREDRGESKVLKVKLVQSVQ